MQLCNDDQTLEAAGIGKGGGELRVTPPGV